MEHTSDVNEIMHNLSDSAHVRRKANDGSSQQAHETFEPSAVMVLPQMNWPEHDIPVGHFHHDAQCTRLHSPEGHEDIVKELTLTSYKSSNLTDGDSSANRVELQPAQSTLQDCRSCIPAGPMELSSEDSSRISKILDANTSFLSHFMTQKSLASTHLDHKVSSKIFPERKTDITSETRLTRPYNGIRTEGPHNSGLSPFAIKKALKAKEVSSRCPSSSGEPDSILQSDTDEMGTLAVQLTPNAPQKSGFDDDILSPFNSTSRNNFPIHDNGISLRSYLKQRCNKLNVIERLHIFKQIVELVDMFHSKGLTLKHVQPSYFIILPSKQIKYVGSVVPEVRLDFLAGKGGQHNEHLVSHLKRRRDQQYGRLIGENLSSKHQKVVSSMPFPSNGSSGELDLKIDAESFKEVRNSVSLLWKQPGVIDAHYDCQKPERPDASSVHGQKVTLNILNMERQWYASPEELRDSFFSTASNIYSLGVLLFEIFGCFVSSEAHLSAMSDLRHRVLPPNFLCEHPKEAGICLWMLHPESSSRPKTREILQCDILREDKDIPFINRLSSYVDEEDADTEVILDFLLLSKEQKEKRASRLMETIQCLESDIQEIEKRYSSRSEVFPNIRVRETQSNHIYVRKSQTRALPIEHISGTPPLSTGKSSLMENFDQLENVYFSLRSKFKRPGTSSTVRSDLDLLNVHNQLSLVQDGADSFPTQQESSDGFGTFFEGLCKYSRHTKFNLRGRLRTADSLNSANVICSLSFDHNEEYFAAAGASKKIKIFEFDSLLNGMIDIHYPVIEMSNKSKLSCVCWNNYIRNYLASTDYDGIVQLWDANTGQGLARYAEHQERAWSVDFSQEAPTKLASGSDDFSVKLWSIHEKNSIETISNMGNVCCVQFSSYSPHLLAFGSADYRIYCYDLRHTKVPWCSLVGHEKAVSYIKFVDHDTIVSASTDSTLKLWDLKETRPDGLSPSACCLTMTGHVNEKNFVGLSVSDGYVVCGSENNEVFAYYRALPIPITSYKFGHIDPITGQETGDDHGQFVSSVCWRKKSNMVIAANSSGYIKLLQMV